MLGTHPQSLSCFWPQILIEHSRSMDSNPSVHGVCMAALARMLPVLVLAMGEIRIEDDARLARERHEALAAGAADQRKVCLPRELDAPGREPGARDQHGDAHLDCFDDHLRGEPA